SGHEEDCRHRALRQRCDVSSVLILPHRRVGHASHICNTSHNSKRRPLNPAPLHFQLLIETTRRRADAREALRRVAAAPTQAPTIPSTTFCHLATFTTADLSMEHSGKFFGLTLYCDCQAICS